MVKESIMLSTKRREKNRGEKGRKYSNTTRYSTGMFISYEQNGKKREMLMIIMENRSGLKYSPTCLK